MREVWILAGRELKSFLRTPLGYAILAVYAFVSGLVFVTLLFLLRQQLLQATPTPGAARPPAVSLQLTVVAPYFYNVATLLLFVLPFVTMRAFADDRRSRRLEVLVSYPLRVWQIALGKFLGACGFALLLVGVTLLHVLILAGVSSPEPAAILGGLLGLLLYAVALVAIGVFVSSLIAGQVEAAVLTLGLFLLFALVGIVLQGAGAGLGRVIANLSPLYQYQWLSAGLLAPGRLLFFPAVTILAFALTLRGVDLIKWRG